MTRIRRIFKATQFAAIGLLAAAVVAFGAPGAARAEVGTIRIAEQFGIAYLPMHFMQKFELIEKHAKASGLDTKVEWLRFSGGAAMNEALLSDNLDVVAAGAGPTVTIWDRTKGIFDVKAMAAVVSLPMSLNTINPDVKTLKDFTDKDRIALPAVRVSIQAVALQMAAEKEFGEGNHTKIDHLTVSMPHPDGTAAILSGQTEITAHLTAPPFSFQQLREPQVKSVFSSYEVLGGPHTFVNFYCRSDFREKNPKTYAAFMAAYKEALEMLNADFSRAADVYIEVTGSRLDKAFIEEMLNSPDIKFTMEPQNMMKFANFMHKIGSIKNKPESWKDLYFPEVHDQAGS